MYTIENFYESFMHQVYATTEQEGIYAPEAFLKCICDYLVEDAEIDDNYIVADYIATGAEAHGYSFDEERGVLTLFVHHFEEKDEIPTVGYDKLTAKIKRVQNFFTKCVDGLYKNIEETSSAYAMASAIFINRDKINRVRFLVVTNAKNNSRKEFDLSEKEVAGYKAIYKIFDIKLIFNIYKKDLNEEIDINVENILGAPLSCIKAPTTSVDYDSYLLVVPAPFLYEIYDEYGQKLLEENVRTFLQFKGKVNKGLKATIKERPELFFAYNNGLTTVAKNIDLIGDENSGYKIKHFYGLQIVNGGQTTSAIYAAKKNHSLNIDNVYVQMKLSVIKDQNQHHEAVSKISEYANTQNKVTKADFFSNRPFQKDFKELSEKVFAPLIGNRTIKQRWYYERTRGQYLNDQAYMTKGEKKAFTDEWPTNQKVDKILLSKNENAWRVKPAVVCKGGQYCFGKFADFVTEEVEDQHLKITEQYFRNAISKIIIWKKLEKLIRDSGWCDGYRSNTIAYTVALLANYYNSQNRYFNFDTIWENQDIEEDLQNALLEIAHEVYEAIIQPPKDMANANEWTKREKCWEDQLQYMEVASYLDPILDKYTSNNPAPLFVKMENISEEQIEMELDPS